MKTNIRLGDVLVEHGYITEEQVELAVSLQKNNRSKRLGEILLEMGVLTEDQLLVALANHLKLQIVDLKHTKIDLNVVKRIPKSVSMKHTMLAVEKRDAAVVVVVNDPLNFYGIEDVRSFIEGDVEIIVCKKAELVTMIRQSYAELDARKAADIADASSTVSFEKKSIDLEGIADDNDTPIVKLVNTVILKAYSEGVSDIHFEPFEDFLNIRFRSDGQLLEYMKLDIGVALQLAIRIKILSDLDIAERRIPQDGNFKVQVGGENVGIRVSVIPTAFGEKIVLRFLSQHVRLDNADMYGMNEENFAVMERILKNPHGIIYITGPTGSGKTTTLYMMLEAMSQKPINISTIEDPVERNLDRITQVQVNTKAGLTFEAGLRSMLRQDPDVILVGETRDSETAQIAVSAAITGHLVLSTLHTNDAISSIVRLSDMGIKSYLIANSVAGVVAQRLVKKVCPFCKEEYIPDDVEKSMFPNATKLYRGTGCDACNNSGYKGRIAIHEILEVDKEIRSMITNNLPTEQIYAHVRNENKMHFMKDNIYQLVLDGVTTVEEFNKHTSFDI